MPRERRKPVTLECVVCGAEFDWTPYNGSFRRKTCSPACRSELHRKVALARPSLPSVISETLTCEVCGSDFDFARPKRQHYRQRTCSAACRAEAKRRKQKYRRGIANPNFRHGKRAGVRDRLNEPRWFAAMVDHCQNPHCDGPVGKLAQHHICYVQEVRKMKGDRFDPRNGMTLCARCHVRHHHRTAALRLNCLPSGAFEYAAELLGPERAFNYLRRRYQGDDVRLYALLGD